MQPTLLVEGSIKSEPQVVPINHVINTVAKMRMKGENILILKSDTGSGKSTILPAYLFKQFPEKTVLIIEPKVYAVNSICNYMDGKFGLALHKNLGYTTGQETAIPPEACVLYTTFGSFSQKIITENDDHLRKSYGIIIIDEAHDMDLFACVVFKNLRDFAARNKNRKDSPVLIFTSATLHTRHFCEYFGAQSIKVSGHKYNVKENYLKYEPEDYMKSTIEILNKIYNYPGDILIFMPGIKDIEYFLKNHANKYKKSIIIPLYRNAIINRSEGYQQLTSNKKKKIILSTPVAESGITFENLKYVIDVGLIKSSEYIHDMNVYAIFNKSMNKYSYKQRLGRLGRTSDGEYYGIFTENAVKNIRKDVNNGMYREDISANLIYLMTNGSALENLDLIYMPTEQAIWRGVEKLFLLGFIDDKHELTVAGKIASKMRVISIEQIKIILSGFVWKVSILDLILVALSLSIDVEFEKQTIFAMESECELMPIIEEFHVNGANGILKNVFPIIMDVRDSIIDSLATCGLDAFMYESNSYPGQIDYVKKIKHCIYEGLKLNSAYWDGAKYVTQTGIEIYETFPCHINAFVYSHIKFIKNSDQKIIHRKSALDGFVNYTHDFF